MTPATSADHLAEPFLRLLFDDAPGFLEFRLIEDKGGKGVPKPPRIEFFDSVDTALRTLPKMQAWAESHGCAVFFGVLPRKEKGRGRKLDIAPGWVAWVDLDFKATAEVEAEARLACLPQPSIVVRSGHGLHLYWLMKEPTEPAELENLSRRLAHFVGADTKCVDASRILRLPGTLNLKEGWATGAFVRPAASPVVLLPSCDGNLRYIVDDFELVPDVAVASAPAARATPEQRAAAQSARTDARGRRALDALDRKTRALALQPTGKRTGLWALAHIIGREARDGHLDPEDGVRAMLAALQCPGSTVENLQVAELAIREGVDAGLAEPAPPPVEEAPPPGDEHAPPTEPTEEPTVVLDAAPPTLTDLGNARRLVLRDGKDHRNCAALPSSGWLAWDGRRWATDETMAIVRAAKRIHLTVADEADALEARLAADGLDPKEIEERLKPHRAWVHACQNQNRINAAVSLAATEPEIVVRKTALDANPWLFNTLDGVLTLDAASFTPHNRDHHCTRLANVGFNVDARCPTWDAFLLRVMNGRQELVDYLQRAVGYSLTGSTAEQVFFILYGNGQNGKSTFVETIRDMMGDYARSTPVETFVGRREGSIPNDVAALDGARLVTSSEPREGAPLDESLVKAVTGGDMITARFMHREFFDFKPQFKLWLSTNHKPTIKGTDNGIWRRVQLIPFDVRIPDEEKDPHLPAKLRAERDGILRWALLGLDAWRTGGLQPPEAVLAAVKGYRGEMDVIAEFLSDCCAVDRTAKASNKALYSAFVTWCKDNGEFERSHRWFSQRLKDRAIEQVVAGDGSRQWIGLRLTTPPTPSLAYERRYGDD